ncbi:MAG: metal ABC transporter permease [Candidatus Thermoplasmatota archaeon]
MVLPGPTEVFGYDFMVRALVAGLVVALVAAILGVFNVLRGMALVSDGLAHVSLAGVAIGLVAGLYPLWAGLAAAILGGFAIQFLRERSLVKSDTAIGIVFSAGLAIGIALISRGGGLNVNVGNYLFGSILAVTRADLLTVAIAGAVLIVALVVFYKELLYLAFNEDAARVSGLPVTALNSAFTVLTAITVVLSARVVGVLLVSALMIVPAASGLQLARSFRGALAISVLLGMVSVIVGLYASFVYDVASGAAIALASTAVFLVSAGLRVVLART